MEGFLKGFLAILLAAMGMAQVQQGEEIAMTSARYPYSLVISGACYVGMPWWCLRHASL